MDKSGAGAGFHPRTWVSPANLHSICFSTIIFTITRGWHKRPGVAAMPIASQSRIKKKVYVKSLHTCFEFGRSRVHISAQRPPLPTGALRDLPTSLYTKKAETMHQIRPLPLPSKSLPIYHSLSLDVIHFELLSVSINKR
jgi:hypothetical protein